MVVNKLRRLFYSPKLRTRLLRLRPIVKPVLLLLGMHRHEGRLSLDKNKNTVIIVSHEASATGAPILALNLSRRLSIESNVVVMLLRGGSLIPDFEQSSVLVLRARFGIVFASLLERELSLALGKVKPRYALVNSVVSAPFIQPLRSIGVPPICLVHEFSAYIRPLTLLNDIGCWSSAMVFSSPVTRDDILRRCPDLQHVFMPILPQGPCERPDRPGRQASFSNGAVDATVFLSNLRSDTVLIIGAGEIQPRKGVDLFISVADQIRQYCREKSVAFAWIGSGYDPQFDFSVSLWIDDQIYRSGLVGQLQMLEHSAAYSDLLERADLFLLTSRLDPLPNVAIDALLLGKPVLCFERACGIADLVITQSELGSKLVAPYLNTARMAEQAAWLINYPDERVAVSQEICRCARQWFDMDNYVDRLCQLGEQASRGQAEHEYQLNRLIHYDKIIPEFGFCKPGLTRRSGTEQYMLAWQTEILPRKPFPGFHPGVYRDIKMKKGDRTDPLLHFLDSGCPLGAWNQPVISPRASTCALPADLKVALHVHVFYEHLFAEILEALLINSVRPDLYITVSSRSAADNVKAAVAETGLCLSDVVIVPNRGRDIGPLLTELGSYLDQNYSVYGHMHTKQSAYIGLADSKRWRRFLVCNLLGSVTSGKMADHIIAAIWDDPRLGLVFVDDPFCVGWSLNRSYAEKLALDLRLPPLPAAMNFPIGTMFWARQGALRPLYELGLQWQDYPPEPLAYDGSVLHAIERLLPLVAEYKGFRCAVTHVPGVIR